MIRAEEKILDRETLATRLEALRAEGKKIRWYDFFEAVWTLVKYRFIHEPKTSLARPTNAEPATPVMRPVG